MPPATTRSPSVMTRLHAGGPARPRLAPHDRQPSGVDRTPARALKGVRRAATSTCSAERFGGPRRAGRGRNGAPGGAPSYPVAVNPDACSPPAVARRVADALAALPAVEAIALAGSQGSGAADERSDVDLYVYAAVEPAREARRAIAGAGAEIGNAFFEPGDEWVDAASGVGVDVMYRTPAWIEDELDRMLVRHEARVGYSTAFWGGVRRSVALFDRHGWYARLAARAAAPYPEPLVRAVVARNQPLLRRNQGSYLRQLENAVARGDRVSANHRTAAFLASAFDLLFAINREPHPGEKRLLALAEARCPRRPPGFSRDVEALLVAAADPGPELLRRADALGEGIDALLREDGLID